MSFLEKFVLETKNRDKLVEDLPRDSLDQLTYKLYTCLAIENPKERKNKLSQLKKETSIERYEILKNVLHAYAYPYFIHSYLIEYFSG